MHYIHAHKIPRAKFYATSSMFRLLLPVFLLALISAGTAVAQQPADKRSYRERADEHLRNRDYASAAEFLREWVRALPRDVGSAVTLARCYMHLRQPDSAMKILQLAGELGCGDVSALAADTLFTPLKKRRQFDSTLVVFRRNADAADDFPQKLAPQTRFGRYRILYPPGYDARKKYHLILLLHGNGQEPPVMLRWAKNLGFDNAIVVCPEAPYEKFRETVSTFARKLSAAGEDLNAPDSLKDDVIDMSADWYYSVLEDARASLPVKPSLPVIMGFSQGGFYAAVIATRRPESFAGVVMMCASMYPEGKVIERLPNLFRFGVEVFLTHGSDDATVPFQTAELFRNSLDNEKVNHVYFPFRGGHWPSEEATRRIAEWVQRHLYD
jgi:phospholipase/carboxylesterase